MSRDVLNRQRRWQLFTPILAGARLTDRLVACVGALFGICAAGLASGWVADTPGGLLLLGPIGASAVLVFAVPSSPLAQPWAVVGGSCLSAATGLLVAQTGIAPAIGAGVAVAAAILIMSLARCLHPPGGAAALLAAFAGPGADGAGSLLLPIALNAAAVAVAGWLFHKLSGHSYPHRAASVPRPAHPGLTRVDIDEALNEIGEAFDIDRDDLESLLRLAERNAVRRRQ